jgi:hypothetical protein
MTSNSNDFIEQQEFNSEMIKSQYNDEFMDIYNNIKDDSMYVSTDILSYDHIGCKNVGCKVIMFVNSCIRTNMQQKYIHNDDDEYTSE